MIGSKRAYSFTISLRGMNSQHPKHVANKRPYSTEISKAHDRKKGDTKLAKTSPEQGSRSLSLTQNLTQGKELAPTLLPITQPWQCKLCAFGQLSRPSAFPGTPQESTETTGTCHHHSLTLNNHSWAQPTTQLTSEYNRIRRPAICLPPIGNTKLKEVACHLLRLNSYKAGFCETK